MVLGVPNSDGSRAANTTAETATPTAAAASEPSTTAIATAPALANIKNGSDNRRFTLCSMNEKDCSHAYTIVTWPSYIATVYTILYYTILH